MSLVTLITPTGGRPEAWIFCQRFIARQSYKGAIQWIVINDIHGTELVISDEIKACSNVSMEVYQSSKPWRAGINTQRPNMDDALPHVKGDFIFVIEDDDCYMPDYIKTMMFLMQEFPLVGQGNSRYFNLKERRYKEWQNFTHTSLCETALRKEKLDLLDRAVNSGDLFMDGALWRIIRKENHKYLLFNHIGLVCGIKGLPGKIGIGGGHTPDESFAKDPFLEKLKSWIGLEYAEMYVSLIQKVK